MKRLAFRSPRYDSGPNMTPLVDVVMVILIFLMLAGNFASAERVLKTELPSVGTGSGLAVVDPGLQFDLYVTAAAPGEFVGRANGIGRVTDVDMLTARLTEQHARYAAAGTSPDSVLVVIHAGPRARWGALAGAYDAALRASFKKVAFAGN